MLYFTSDLHFYHDKIIRHIHRPFQNAEEMNDILIKKWNAMIDFEDEVYILGDVTMKGAALAHDCLSALNGTKHLIRGNHDNFIDSPKFNRSLFASIQDYAEIPYGNTHFILCHYPFLEWNECRRGTIHLHGHQHNHADYNSANRQKGTRRYDVGVDANDMAPVNADKILAFFNDIPI